MKTRATVIIWSALLALTALPALAARAPEEPKGPWFDACERHLDAARLAFARHWSPIRRAKVMRERPDPRGVLGLLPGELHSYFSLRSGSTWGNEIWIAVAHGVRPGLAKPGHEGPRWVREQDFFKLQLEHFVRGGEWDATLRISRFLEPRFTPAQVRAFERIFKPALERCLATPP